MSEELPELLASARRVSVGKSDGFDVFELICGNRRCIAERKNSEPHVWRARFDDARECSGSHRSLEEALEELCGQ